MDRQVICNTEEPTALLKALANETRLSILCHLVEGEKSVTELEHLIGIRQPTLSQHLARLRQDCLVTTRREVKSVHYSLASEKAALMIQLLHVMFHDSATGRTVTLSLDWANIAE